jgi:hypothetical protein
MWINGTPVPPILGQNMPMLCQKESNIRAIFTIMTWQQKPLAEVTLYGQSLSSFVTLDADDFDMPVSVHSISVISVVCVLT